MVNYDLPAKPVAHCQCAGAVCSQLEVLVEVSKGEIGTLTAISDTIRIRICMNIKQERGHLA